MLLRIIVRNCLKVAAENACRLSQRAETLRRSSPLCSEYLHEWLSVGGTRSLSSWKIINCSHVADIAFNLLLPCVLFESFILVWYRSYLFNNGV